MIPIKIECGCGQHYAFDIEPVGGRMPCSICCPTCGMDGSEAADEYIAQVMAQPVAAAAVAAPVVARLRESSAPAFTLEAPPEPPMSPAARNAARFTKQIDLVQITHEARAKTLWGDEPEDVVKFLMLQGLSVADATKLKDELFAERAKTVRSNGIFKALSGAGLMCVPVVTLIGCLMIGYLPLKLIGITGALGLWGFYRVLKGCIMIISPKSEPGDVSEQ